MLYSNTEHQYEIEKFLSILQFITSATTISRAISRERGFGADFYQLNDSQVLDEFMKNNTGFHHTCRRGTSNEIHYEVALPISCFDLQKSLQR